MGSIYHSGGHAGYPELASFISHKVLSPHPFHLKPKPNIQTSLFLNLIFGELESTESRLLTWSSLQTDVMIDKMKTFMDSVGKVLFNRKPFSH